MNVRFATYAASNIFSGVASLLSVLVLLRLLPAEQYGEYATVLVLITLGQTAGFSWLQSSIMRLHADETSEDGRSRFAAAVQLGFMLSALLISALWMIGLFLLQLWSPGRMWLGVGGLLVLLSGAWANVSLGWNRVASRPRRFVAGQSLQALGSLVFAIAGLAWRPGDPLVALGALAAASLLATAVARFPVRSELGEWHQFRPRLREIWNYGGPVTAVSLGYAILAAADRLLIAASIGPAAAGAYAAASAIASRALGLLLPPIAFAVKPQVFLEFSQRGAGPARELMYRMSGWLIAAGLPVTVLFVCAPRPLVTMIAGDELAGAAAEVLPWTAIGAFMSTFLTLHFAMAFQITRRTKWMLFVVAPAAAFDILCNVLLLPRFGIVAAGWSMVASYAIALVLAIGFGSRHFRVPFSYSDLARTAAACLPLVTFLQLEFQPTMLGITLMLAGGALIYLGCAFLLNVVSVRTHLIELARKFGRGAQFGIKAD